MHKLPNKSAVLLYRLVALIVCVKWVLITSTAAIFSYAFFVHDREMVILGIKLAAATSVVLLARLIYAPSCKCPLCRVPILSSTNCAKNHNAQTRLGSYRLRVAIEILFANHFGCPYCNEPTEMKSRR